MLPIFLFDRRKERSTDGTSSYTISNSSQVSLESLKLPVNEVEDLCFSIGEPHKICLHRYALHRCNNAYKRVRILENVREMHHTSSTGK